MYGIIAPDNVTSVVGSTLSIETGRSGHTCRNLSEPYMKPSDDALSMGETAVTVCLTERSQ